MIVKVIPRKLGGEIDAISSKSNAHRVLICSAFSKDKSTLKLETRNVDIDTTIESLESLGAVFKKRGKLLDVNPIKDIKESPTLNCRESGSTFRFMLPVACAVSSSVNFLGEGRLPDRPIDELKSEMIKKGVEFSEKKLPFTTKGLLKGGEYNLPGHVSSQYFSGILMAAPLIGEDVKINMTTPLESRGYVNMTLDTMRDFNIDVEEGEDYFTVRGNQSYETPSDYTIEGDWSNAAFFLCAGALKGDVTVKGLNSDSSQGDREIIEILRDFGAEIHESKGNFQVKGTNLKAIDLDISEVPDLFPILSIVATQAKGETKFTNAGRLRIKESDRIKAMNDIITSLGGKCIEKDEEFIVLGGEPLKGGVLDSHNDHRIAMAAAIASIVSENEVTIENAQAVNKSYPGFFEDFKILKGECHVI